MLGIVAVLVMVVVGGNGDCSRNYGGIKFTILPYDSAHLFGVYPVEGDFPRVKDKLREFVEYDVTEPNWNVPAVLSVVVYTDDDDVQDGRNHHEHLSEYQALFCRDMSYRDKSSSSQ